MRQYTKKQIAAMAAVYAEAERLVRQGWCQEKYCTDKDGKIVALGDTKAFSFSIEAALTAAGRVVKDYPGGIVPVRDFWGHFVPLIPENPRTKELSPLRAFNDHPETTQEQAVRFFRQCCEDIESRVPAED